VAAAAQRPQPAQLTAVASTGDTLAGSLSIQAGTGTAYSIVAGVQPSGGPALNTF